MTSKRKKDMRPGLHRSIEEMAEFAQMQARGAAYVIYVIVDPTQPDPLDIFESLPIYVGVSSQVRRRVKNHCRCAGQGDFGRHQIGRPIRKLLRQNIVPGFKIIDHLDNKIDAMIAETVHAQRLLRAGYILYNRWIFQRMLLNDQEMEKVVARIRQAGAMEERGWS